MKRLFRKGQKFNTWTLVSYLGGGGNGEVWQCKNVNDETRAIKLLKRIKPKSYLRFIDETFVIESNTDIIGLIPIIEKNLPQNTKNQIPFYIMPLAEASEKRLSNKTIEEKIDAIIEIAKTLAILHSRKIYHRDIKPANILFYDSKYCFADFGLVDFPNKKEISLRNEEIGPKWTMAPEMRRESSLADGAKADVYSLAKTLWIYLTGGNKGFDGQYSTESIIDLKKFYPESYTSPIDNLLISCTDNDPIKRPSINEFVIVLDKWKKLTEDFHERNQQQWFEIQTKLFPTAIPQRVIWKDINDIVKILKIVCSFDNLNHAFFPGSGGLDLEDVRLSYEEGCIELDFQIIHIVKPKRLLFESFGFEHQWNYFRLELDELTPTNANEYDDNGKEYEKEKGREKVSELSPGNYYPFEILENRDYYENDYLITDFSRHVRRWFSGCFVIFCKRSNYNLNTSTYDGRHNRMTTDEFRDYIQSNVNSIREELNGDDKILNLISRKGEEIKKREFKHIIEEELIYRCGWCGKIVDSNGDTLDDYTRNYNIKVIEKFGHNVVERVEGNCCKGKKHM